MTPATSTPPISEYYPFLTEVVEIRRRARAHVQGDIAEGEIVMRLLGEALATEVACVLRYRRHQRLAVAAGDGDEVAAEFARHEQEEHTHAGLVAQRIAELGGDARFDPPGLLARSCEYSDGESLADMLEEDLIAERIAVDNYREMIEYLGDRDAATRRVLQAILAAEEGHVRGLVGMRDQALRRERAAGVPPS